MTKRILNYGRSKLALLDEHTLEVIKKTIPSIILKVGGMAITLLLSITLGRTLGAEGLGIINLANRIIIILLVLAMFGYRQIIVKEIAIAISSKNMQRIKDIVYSSHIFNGGLTIVISILFLLLSKWISNNIFNEPQLSLPLNIMIVVMVPQVITRILSSGLIAYKKIWQANLVDRTLSVLVTTIIIYSFYLFEIEINIINTAIAYAVGRVVVTLTISTFWKTLYSYSSKPKNIIPELSKKSVPLFFSEMASVVTNNTDILIIGIFSDATSIGLYAVASRIAQITLLIQGVTNSALSSNIAQLYSNNKIANLKVMVQRVTLGLIIIGVIQFALITFIGKPILSLWGVEFQKAHFILIILSFGQLIALSTGASGQLLVMCGFGKILAKITMYFSIINIALMLILAKFYGILGVSIASTTTIIGTELFKMIFAYKKTGVLTMPFNLFSKK